ncbi:hypothetical protein [Novacetimonas hansenii]|uniref:Carbohydrate kinase n=2 Tax=Novacetimonas hansenii TaxID=436 RepID=A0ABQ0SJ31_NOVHA|nr:hypothetical protein [Novacetimonas hansenii]EFG83723.1 hypothetical protein GXY_11828 [Novacetimonas hansenii ATCC 23769]GAN84801.1 hypothetical protein Gaha_0232_001 [Novacetimonas hansenii JCM 7643]GBQ58721.1 hypothetical protein AA0243_1867 [Novacetimonas hansenii NRIC 0243]GEC65216.1 carbohydrate kinase [Novacetimonas hansenii]
MYRLANGTQVATLPAPAADSGTPGYATWGVVGGQDPSIIDPDMFNIHQEELISIVTAGGITPDKTNNAQVLAALRVLFAPLSALTLASSPLSPVSASTTVVVPAGVTRVYLEGTGSGGGGAGCAATTTSETYSGSGGSGGCHMRGVYAVTAGDSLAFTIGSGGPGNLGPGSGYAGGDTSCVNGAGKRLQYLPGGNPGVKNSNLSTAGGNGTTGVSDVTGTFLSAIGNDGSDGQAGTAMLTGNGGAGPYGGAGRAGLHGGFSGGGAGAGGGGAYDSGLTGANYAGGNGAGGAFLFKWLP